MKHILLIFILLLPVMVFGQSRQSNKLYKQGMELFNAEKYEEAVPYFQQSDSLDKKKLKPTSENYYRAELKMADCYEELAGMSYYDGKYSEAIKYQTFTMEIRKKILGDKHPEYAESLSDLGVYYNALGNIAEAIRLVTISLKIYKNTIGEDSPKYAVSLACLAHYQNCIGNYNEAIRLLTLSIKIFKETVGENDVKYAISLDNLASYYSNIDNYSESIRLGTLAMETFKKVLGEESREYAISLSRLAMHFHNLGDYLNAIKIGTIAMEKLKGSLGEEHLNYIMALSKLALFYDDIGNYAEAIRLGTIVSDKLKLVGEKHPAYANSLNDLAMFYYDNGEYTETIRLETIVLENRKEILGEDHPEYAISLNNLALCNAATGNLTEAMKLGKIAIEKHKNNFGEESLDYAISVGNLASYYSAIGNFTESVGLESVTMNLFKKILGDKHPLYAKSLRHLANYTFLSGINDDAVKLYKQSYECTNAFIRKNFASMTNKERTDFWNLSSDFFSKDLPLAAYKINTSDLTALAYNGLVFSKGLLLNAELEIQKLIEQSHDTTFANRYYKIRQDRANLDDLYQIPLHERTINADSLLKVIENEERLLVQSSNVLGDYTKNLSVDWHDIQKNMKDSDLAIEFANFKDTSKQQIYVALVLKKGMKSPEFVKLFTQDDFYDIPSDEYYKTTKLYNLVWKPLETHLQGVKNVYFSPCGKFHTIGIEYHPDESGKIFAEKSDAYRLSSTRELALSKEINPNKKAATYGGIKYGEDNNGTGKRGVATYLKGSKIESDTVAKLLQSADYEVIALSDTIATEESFKKLSGTGLKILHIGTHGFYYSESALENAGFSFFSNNNQQSKEDKALSCSGLLFAGANFALDTENRSALPEGDDGILTAKEISRLDFQGLDLVVLSACQTGLGEVTGEGVFGLQRGFKKAGAQTIVMSLWEVDDYATRLLMTEFFKGLTAGKTKREAFISALNFVKAKNSDPKYWAAFVMVDGE